MELTLTIDDDVAAKYCDSYHGEERKSDLDFLSDKVIAHVYERAATQAGTEAGELAIAAAKESIMQREVKKGK